MIKETMFGGNNLRLPSRKRKRNYEFDEVDPSKRLRGEPSLPTRHPYKHNFNNVDGQSHKFELFFGWRSPFSQHHPVTFTVDNKVFNCAEQYYMFRKAALFEDTAIEEKIMNSSDPKEQKRLGKQIQNFNFDTWMQHSMEVVETGNMAKFSQNPNLKKKLFATSPRLMVEASPYDATWGIALHKNDPRAWDERTWQGKNLLGQILTKVRDNLMRQEGVLGDKEEESREKTGYNTAAIYNSDRYHRNNSDDMDRRRAEWHSFSHRERSESYGQRTSSSGCPDSHWELPQRTYHYSGVNTYNYRSDRQRNPGMYTQKTDSRESYSRGDSEVGSYSYSREGFERQVYFQIQ